MNSFKSGQRWVCDTDLQLGLGTIQSVEKRTVSITFKTTGETRTYARESAPLTRVIFNIGDTIENQEGFSITITSIHEENGLFIYTGNDKRGKSLIFEEHQLAHHLQLNQPITRLLNHQFDADKWFRIRYQTWLKRNQLVNSPLYGLLGTRTSLIPHQLYIAHEIGRRYAPRVLLADEVGLGKTIEAGMILHQQHLTGRAERILIVVPETLTHQWLVEMLRRFNLHFSVFNDERIIALEKNQDGENPFYSEQLIICSLDFLCNNSKHFQLALAGSWDLLVVDEAHHLEWTETASSPAYQVIEQLARCTHGILLLTATPEQFGKASHFARLRLLDPDRFSNLRHFIKEEQAFEPIANIVEALLANQPLNETFKRTILSIENTPYIQSLIKQLQKTDTRSESHKQAQQALTALLLDRHGTGRILFRNTRATIDDFPERKLSVIPLPLPNDYTTCLSTIEKTSLPNPQLLLNPEQQYQTSTGMDGPKWTDIDPRIPWLHKLILQLKPRKILVITATALTARDITRALKSLTGQYYPVFNEHMDLMERDRAAALFADSETGCQVLVCSEIGSEGRNFQFAHHLVLFDLPFSPDLLEQRIGRLDRIGQTETINIYAPILKNSAQEIMLRWYHDGLNALEKTCQSGQALFKQFENQLIDTFLQRDTESLAFSDLINRTRALNQSLCATLEQGRDRLLESNSFRPKIAEQIYTNAISNDACTDIQHYMDKALDCFGIHIEEHRTGSYRLQPGEHMAEPLPGMYDEGVTITYNRSVALANEDMQFLTWEHPLVTHVMDRILSNENGNATVSCLSHRNAPPGQLFLECLFVLDITTPSTAAKKQNLPNIMIRTLVDEHGCSNHPALDHETINLNLTSLSQHISGQVIELKKETIRNMTTISEQIAQSQMPTATQKTKSQLQETFAPEIERLKALKQVNPNVRVAEIEFFEQLLADLIQAVDDAHARLDAMRVIVAT